MTASVGESSSRLPLGLRYRGTPAASIESLSSGRWRLQIPPGPAATYRLAQLDDCSRILRGAFPWRPPLRLDLRARVSSSSIPGTWGFGFWNDPFALNLGISGSGRRFPALPQTAWFFYASHPNHLALRDSHPATGFLASAFSSRSLSGPLLALALPAVPLLAWPFAARHVRQLGQRLVHEYAASLSVDPREWHAYCLEWHSHARRPDMVRFFVDGETVAETTVAPRAPLGLVIWIDNQYAAFPPDGRVAFGRLANPEPAWLEVEGLTVAPRIWPVCRTRGRSEWVSEGS